MAAADEFIGIAFPLQPYRVHSGEKTFFAFHVALQQRLVVACL
jgi:hypothetical protein